MRKHRKVSECPNELQAVIDLVNILMSEQTSEPEPKIEDKILPLLYNLIGRKRTEKQVKAELRKIIKSKILFDYLFLETELFGFASEKLIDLRKSATALGVFAYENKIIFDKYGIEGFTHPEIIEQYAPGISIFPSLFEQGFSLVRESYTIDKKGNIRPILSTIDRIFTEHRIPFNRIRFCPVCDFVFWAKRLDAKTCGKKQCADLLSQRNLRATKSDEINQKRRKNYVEKKRLAALKEKNNDTL